MSWRRITRALAALRCRAMFTASVVEGSWMYSCQVEEVFTVAVRTSMYVAGAAHNRVEIHEKEACSSGTSLAASRCSGGSSSSSACSISLCCNIAMPSRVHAEDVMNFLWASLNPRHTAKCFRRSTVCSGWVWPPARSYRARWISLSSWPHSFPAETSRRTLHAGAENSRTTTGTRTPENRCSNTVNLALIPFRAATSSTRAVRAFRVRMLASSSVTNRKSKSEEAIRVPCTKDPKTCTSLMGGWPQPSTNDSKCSRASSYARWVSALGTTTVSRYRWRDSSADSTPASRHGCEN
mmetsp:Transcript_79245/g.181499  ORF Transcript_79245/g.181499 Transcript_79245/m.181499 type:complete len:295 (+) Transcript_79245:189-1073(+)